MAPIVASLAIAALLVDAMSPCSILQSAGSSAITATAMAPAADAESETIMIAACPCGCHSSAEEVVGLSLPAILPRTVAELDVFPSEQPNTPYVRFAASAPHRPLHQIPRSLS